MVGFEAVPGFRSRAVEDNNLEGAHKGGHIGHSVEAGGSVVVDLAVVVLGVVEETDHLAAVTMGQAD